MDKQLSTNTTKKTKDRATPLKPMVNSGAPKGYVIPAPLVTSVTYFIKVRIPSQENKRSCLFMSVVSVLSLFLRYLDYALEFVQQCAFLLCIFIFLATIAIWNFDDYCKNFHLCPYKPITNTTWACTRLCKLQKRCARFAAASDKVYQSLVHGRWFSPGTPAASTTKTGRHDIGELLLKVALNTIHQIKSNLFIWKRSPLVFVVQFDFLSILSHVSIFWKAQDQSWVSLDMKVCWKVNISYSYLTNNALVD